MWTDPELTLTLWERAAGRSASLRDEVLLGSRPSSLTERNLAALHRYASLFGSRVELLGRCPHCAASVEFFVDTETCARQLPMDVTSAAWHEVEAAGESARFRLPQPADLHALEHVDDELAFAERLLDRCVEGGLPDSHALRDAISQQMEALAPGAGVHFALQCPGCTQVWTAPLDPVDLLWRELRRRAEQLLVDVATLARRCGWNERDILAMSPIRRAAYLQLVTG